LEQPKGLGGHSTFDRICTSLGYTPLSELSAIHESVPPSVT
jgi:hypothetical protein